MLSPYFIIKSNVSRACETDHCEQGGSRSCHPSFPVAPRRNKSLRCQFLSFIWWAAKVLDPSLMLCRITFYSFCGFAILLYHKCFKIDFLNFSWHSSLSTFPTELITEWEFYPLDPFFLSLAVSSWHPCVCTEANKPAAPISFSSWMGFQPHRNASAENPNGSHKNFQLWFTGEFVVLWCCGAVLPGERDRDGAYRLHEKGLNLQNHEVILLILADNLKGGVGNGLTHAMIDQ